jgi:hypothetical protein
VFEQDIDATGQCVLPGLVDAHTHSVWSGDRVHEFASKLAGATYMDVHRGLSFLFSLSLSFPSFFCELYALAPSSPLSSHSPQLYALL